MRAIGIARPLRAPRIAHRAGDLQRLFDLAVVAPHLAPIERPIGAIAEQAARLEPLRPKAQRHHREVHGAAADRLAAVVAAQLQRIVAVADPFVGPVQLLLLGPRRRRNPRAAASTGRHRRPRRRTRARPACMRGCRRRRPVPTMAKSTASSSRYSRIGIQPPTRNTSGARPCLPRGLMQSASSDMAVLARCRSSSPVLASAASQGSRLSKPMRT